MTQVASISQQIWDMKYRLKTATGEPVDKSIADTWRRVARALAAGEADPARREAEFYAAMEDFRFLPAGRILSGAGTDRRVTLFNCFVMGDIPDDMAGIFEHLKQAALTMQQGGGIGYDFSTIRPKGASVKGVGADASGPLSFMDVWDAMCRTIMSAGSRRGAMMATMRCDHPDIEAFIEAKRQPGRLRMFNLSVLATDAFMRAVKDDAAWELVFDGVVYKSLPARALWDKIMRATYAYAEPGVIFIDRINRLNNLWYCETIHATNPCVTADAWVTTAEGPRQVAELVGVPFDAMVDGRPWSSTGAGFFATGRKPVLRLTTAQGHALRLTADHPVRRVLRRAAGGIESDWTPAGRLRPGEEIVLHDHRRLADWPGAHGEDEGYLIGLLLAAGAVCDDRAVLSLWPRARVANGGACDGCGSVMARARVAAEALPGGELAGWAPGPGRDGFRLASHALAALAASLGTDPGRPAITPAMERDSAAFQRGLLQGLFDAAGAVHGHRADALRVEVDGDPELLRAAQRMLLRFGVAAGRDGAALSVRGDNLLVFAERIGFADAEKAARLSRGLAGYRGALGREAFVATVAALEDDGEETVYDVRIPGIHAFDANGLMVHNCGEQPLPAYGVCLLGSVNLAQLVSDPFGDKAALDLERLATQVRTAVRMMDNVIEASKFPLDEHRREALAKRRIGLGITGLADALLMCRVRYGSPQAVRLVEAWMARLQREAYLASVELAKEKGPFPLFDADKYLAGEHVRALDEDVRQAIAAHGIRNALLTSIAPTGTISLFADNVSSGLEPVFAFKYGRSVLMPDGSRHEEEVTDYAYRLYRRLHGDTAGLPDYFVDAQSLSPKDHLVMQAAVQKYVDSSISKTINVPENIDFEAFKDVYMQAYELGCKGCTTYRPNEITGAVLQVAKPDAPQAELPLEPERPERAEQEGVVHHLTQPLTRPEALGGRTYKLRWPESEHAIYITVNDVIQDGRVRPFEVFINSKNLDHYAWTVALTRMISAVFRRGGDVAFVVEELKAVFDPRGGHWMGGRYVPSLLAAIGETIERHMVDIGFLPDPRGEATPAAEKQVVAIGHTARRHCPKCGQPSLVRMEGCDTCHSCGYSKCG